MEDTPTLLTLPRSDGEVRLSRSEYKGKQYIDLRFFWERAPGDLVATKKGITIRPEEAGTVADALTKLAGASE